MKRSLSAVVFSLLLSACSSSGPQDGKYAALALPGLLEGKVVLSLYDGQNREKLFSGTIQDLAERGLPATPPKDPGGRIYLVEVADAAFNSRLGKESVYFPSGATWKTMLLALPPEGSFGFEVNPFTTLAATRAEYLNHQRAIPLTQAAAQAYGEMAAALGVADLAYDHPLDPFTAGAKSGPSLNYALALLGLEEGSDKLAGGCPSGDRWSNYFALLDTLTQDLSDGAIDGIAGGIGLSFCGRKFDSPAAAEAMMSGLARGLVLGHALPDAYPVEEAVPFFRLLSEQRRSLFALPATRSAAGQQVPQLLIREPAPQASLSGLARILVTAQGQAAEMREIVVSLGGAPVSPKGPATAAFEGEIDTAFMASGPASLVALARDEAGNLSLAVQETVINTPARGVAVYLGPPERTALVDGVYIAKGNFEIRAQLLQPQMREILAISSDDSRLTPDLQIDLNPENDFYRAQVFALDRGVGMTPQDSAAPRQFKALVDLGGQTSTLRDFPVRIINHGPDSATSIEDSAGRCATKAGGLVCDKARQITARIQTQTYFRITGVEVALRDSQGVLHPLPCTAGDWQDARCPFDPHPYPDGNSTIEATIHESTGFDTHTSFPLILDNRSLDRVSPLVIPDGPDLDRPFQYAGPLADFDGDGFQDAVTYGSDSGGRPVFTIHWNDGTGNFPSYSTMHGPPGTVSINQVISCDLDGDGKNDLALADPDYNDAQGRTHVGRIAIYFGPIGRDGVPARLAVQEAPDEANTIAGQRYGSFISCGPSVINSGPAQDMIAGFDMAEGENRYLLNYNKTVLLAGGTQDQWAASHNSFCRLPGEESRFGFFRARFAGDLNGDGKNDLVALLPTGGGTGTQISRARVIFGHLYFLPCSLSRLAFCYVEMNGQSQLGPQMSAESNIHDVYPLGDLNGDGLPDFALTIPQIPLSNEGQVRLYYGDRRWSSDLLISANADLQLPPGTSGADGLGSGGVAAGDFDGDGRRDLAVGNKLASRFSGPTLLGRTGLVAVFGGPSFQDDDQGWLQLIDAPAAQPFGYFGYGPAAADLDRDGYSELFTSAPGVWNGNRQGISYLFYKEKHW